jgi:hypothetical protein
VVKTIYQSSPKSYIIRFWGQLKSNLFGVAFLLIVLFTIKSFSFFVLLACSLFVLITLLMPLYDAYHQSQWQVLTVSTSTEVINFELLKRNKRYSFQINKADFNMRLMWIKGRRHIMKLVIHDKEKPLFQAFSDGSKPSEYQLEDIVFQIRKELNLKHR